jgi:uncharacterized membrane protein YfcA
MSTLLIGCIFALGFFSESIIGFGGTLVAFAILGFFVDIKELILIGLYIATSASIFIISSDTKSFKKEIFMKSLPYCFIGTTFGVLLFTSISSAALLKLFGVFLIILSLKTFFFDKIKFPEILVKKLLIIGGFCQGIFGIGGPFIVSALKNQFANKSQLRATMASFFITFNLIRYVQLSITGNFDHQSFLQYWWVPIPLILAIHLGHKVHLKISEQFFKNAIATITLISGLSFLIK